MIKSAGAPVPANTRLVDLLREIKHLRMLLVTRRAAQTDFPIVRKNMRSSSYPTHHQSQFPVRLLSSFHPMERDRVRNIPSLPKKTMEAHSKRRWLRAWKFCQKEREFCRRATVAGDFTWIV